MNIKEVILRINYFRNQRNISASELSGMIGKHSGYINKLESKGFNLPTEILLNIFDALQISPCEFFADNYKTYNIDNHLLKSISKLDKDKKDAILTLIEK